jgi:hypothetical protein
MKQEHLDRLNQADPEKLIDLTRRALSMLGQANKRAEAERRARKRPLFILRIISPGPRASGMIINYPAGPIFQSFN